MSDYSKTTNFTAKDSLTSGDPNKVIKGATFDTEFDALATASATKSNKVVSGTTNNVIKQSSGGDLTDSGYSFSGLSGDTAVTKAEIDILDGATLSTAELNTLNGITATTTELNYTDGVTSAIQTQLDFKGALVYSSANITTNTGSNKALTWDTESYDTSTIHDNATNNTRLTVPTGVTKVRLSTYMQFASNSTGYRQARFLKNNADFTGNGYVRIDASSSTVIMITTTSAIVTVTSGDYFESVALQNSGGNLNVTGGSTGSWFAMEIIE